MSETGTLSDSTFTVPGDQAGARLDRVVALRHPGLSRTDLRRLFEERRVRLDGKVAAKGALVRGGETVLVELPAGAEEAGARPDPELAAQLVLVLERPDLLVVDKPAGIPSAPLRSGELGTVANGLLARFPELAAIGHTPREPGLVHRLDTDTSGLLLAARTPAAFETLRTALQAGELDKRYLLLCSSIGLPDGGTIDVALAPHPKDRRRVMACVNSRDRDRHGARPARTDYRVLRRVGELALVEATASPALRHQVRAHFAWLGFPLLGDLLYGGPGSAFLDRHALHASRLSWAGGGGVEAFTVESPLPTELASLLEG